MNASPRPTQRPLALWAAICTDPGDIVEIRQIHATRKNYRDAALAKSSWVPSHELADASEQLRHDNADGWNIYAGVNPRIAFGERSNDAVRLARVVVADFDHETTENALVRWRATELPEPSFVINSGHGVHVYLRLLFSLSDLKAWREFQKDLAACVKSDPSIHNEERILRLPGFVNHKPPAADSSIVSYDVSARHDFTKLRAAVPYRPQRLTFKSVQAANLVERAGDRVKRCLAYLAKCPDSVPGQHGHDKALRAACEGFRFGLSDSEVREVMHWWGEKKSGGEPWNEEEIEHKLESARKKTAGETGCRLVNRGNEQIASTLRMNPEKRFVLRGVA